MKKTVLYAAVIGASAVLTGSAVAQANPATPMSAIESSAAQLCGAINRNPTEDGVIAGMNSLDNRGLDRDGRGAGADHRDPPRLPAARSADDGRHGSDRR